MSLDVTVLYFDGCPSWQTARQRLEAAAAHCQIPIRVSTRTVETTEDAERLGFTGSPTVLLDGRDPFARPGLVPSLACRVFPTPDGLAGSPTLDQFVDALRGHRAATTLEGQGRPR